MINGKTIIAILQAHMSSTRLPGKILLNIHGEPALFRMIERVRLSKYLDDIVVATSTLSCDDIIIEKCREWGIHTFRGSDKDVLQRYWETSQAYPADIYMRLTSDDPLVDASYLDDLILFFENNNYRYVSDIGGGIVERTLPLGMGGEVFDATLLKEAWENATEAYEHEHVTPYMYWRQPLVGALAYKINASQYRLTMDTQEDYELICKIYDELYRPGNTFGLENILSYLENHPEVAKINSGIVQKNTKSE